MAADSSESYTWRALTPDRWGDLEALFGPNGAYGGCWCMYYRTTRSRFSAQCRDHGGANRETFRAITRQGEPPGILAYEGERPIGWCSVAPRATMPSLDRSRLFKRVDDTPVWSLACFFVDRAFRGQGVMAYLVRAAVEHVRERGGGVIEAYPRRVEGRIPAASGWVGLLPVFAAAGFAEVAQPSASRVIVRRSV